MADPQNWRTEDERVLRSLEDEAAIHALARFQLSREVAPPVRARVLARQLRETPQGEAAVLAAADSAPAALARHLVELPLKECKTELLHSISIYFDWLATNLEGHNEQAWEFSKQRALAAWVGCCSHDAFASRILAGVAPDLPVAERASLQRGLVEAPIESLGEQAKLGVKALDVRGRLAYRQLGRIGEACAAAGVTEEWSRRLIARGEAERGRALEEYLAGVDNELDEVATKDDPFPSALPIFTALHARWEYCDHERNLEHYITERITPICWSLYRQARWEDLKQLLESCARAFERLERRVQEAPLDYLAYSAAAAQIFVFRSEAEPNSALEWQYAQRAITLCPSHRNAKVVLAHLHSNRAISQLDRVTLFNHEQVLVQAEEHMTEAERLFPDSKRLRTARTKYDEARARWKPHG